MGQLGEIPEGVVRQHPDLIVAQVSEKQNESGESFKFFFLLLSFFFFFFSFVRNLGNATGGHACILFTV